MEQASTRDVGRAQHLTHVPAAARLVLELATTYFDATLVKTADELHVDSHISDGTWDELKARYDTAQLIEVPMVVGQYHLVSMTLNSLGVQLDPGLVGFPS